MSNPLVSVGGVTVPCPSSYEWQLYDVSSEDAGRTEDGLMHKNMIGQKRKLSLEWKYITVQQASVVLSAFNAEYTNITYLDLLTGTNRSGEFYTGDRNVPVYNTTLGLVESIKFNVIER